MKRRILGTSLTLVLVLPAVAVANPPTRQHTREYQHDYHAVAQKFGHRAPGRNLIRDGRSDGRKVTDQAVTASIATLKRMLAPPPVVKATPVSYTTPTPTSTSTATTSTASAVTTTATSPATITVGAASGLASCIIQRESGGNSQATNGQYGGIGQWSPTTWASDGGTRYASTPQGATYAQQQAVLNGEGAAGMAQQQGQYDGC